MNPRPDKSAELLLQLGDPTERRTRSRLLDDSLAAALNMLDADAAIALPPGRRRDRVTLYAGTAAPALNKVPPEGSEVLRVFAESPEPLLVPELPDQPRVAQLDGCPGVDPGPAIFAVVRQRGADAGYLAAYRRRGRARFTANDGRQLLLLANWLGIALDNLRIAAGTKRLAVTDDLTDVFNERFIRSALQQEMRRASRFGHALALVLIAADEQAGEASAPAASESVTLREMAAVLARQARAFDVLGRFGDRQFLLILPETAREGATEAAERMRGAIAGHAFSTAPAGSVTAGFGVACFPDDAAEFDDLLAAAARALEKAQTRGASQVATLGRRAA